MDWKLTTVFSSGLAWLGDFNLLQLYSCFGQPFHYGQVIDSFCILLIPLIPLQTAENMKWNKLPF